MNVGIDKRLANAFLIVLLIFVGALAVNTVKRSQFIGVDTQNQRTISVSGEAEKFAKPDLATVTVTVQNEADTVQEAQQQNSERANAVTQFLKEQGIKEEDIKTAQYTINPRYEYRGEAADRPRPPKGERVLAGYEVTNQLKVKIRDLEAIGTVLDGATDNGANRVDGLRFTVENDEEVTREARRQAIQNAREKARTLTGDLGVRLGELTDFNESGGPRPTFHERALAAEDAGDSGGAAPDISPGENKISVNVTLTYRIK